MNNVWSIWGTETKQISSELQKVMQTPPVVLCLGSDLVLSDCLGPLVGTMLKNAGYKNHVYGTLDAPVDSQNLELAYKFIKATHKTQKLLVVDASITADTSRIGKIVLAKDYKPFNKNLQNINLSADYFLFGVCSTYNPNFLNCGTRLALVEKIATAISSSLMFEKCYTDEIKQSQFFAL